MLYQDETIQHIRKGSAMPERIVRKMKMSGLVLIGFLTAGCGIGFETNIPDGTSVKENNISVVFTADDRKAKIALNLKKRKLLVNDMNRTSDTTVENRRPREKDPLRIVYVPADGRLLPEGNVTILLEVPYKKQSLLERVFGITAAKKSLNIFVDTLPPVISPLAPDVNSTVTDDLTVLRYEAVDAGTGIDEKSLECRVEGEEWSGLCSLASGTVSITPDNTHRLPSGRFSVRISLADKIGNRGEYTFSYLGRYDTLPPTITMDSPKPGEIITDPLQKLFFVIRDDENGSGVDAGSASVYFPDENRTGRLVQDTNNTDIFVYIPTDSDPLPYGNIKMVVEVTDNAGNAAAAEFSVFLREKESLSAIPVAVPPTAFAPATVRFYPKVTTDTAVTYYYWDMDGDGSFENRNLFPDSTRRSYSLPGDYRVGLKVVDTNGKTAEGYVTVHIGNAPPQVSVDLEPSNGPVPLTVKFHVTAIDNEGIAKYEWDFNGDGIWDYESNVTGEAEYAYETVGMYNAVLRVTDSRGASTVYTTPTTTVLASDSGSPSVTANASPSSGSAPLTVSFDADAVDPQGKGFKLFRWDFDGDGTWDYNSSDSPAVSHTYNGAGTFYPRVEAVTTDDRTTFDSISIESGQKVTLSVSTDTIDPSTGETATVRSTLSADAPVQLVIEDSLQNPVRILVPWSVRKAGSYEDIWDGLGEGGVELKEGPYYAVLYYKENGRIEKLDLRESTGGKRERMNRTKAPLHFAPYDNRPVRITFTIPRAAEVISFMGYTYSNTRIVTFRNRQPLGRGSYTDVWYSQNDEGAIVKPPAGKYFLYGAWWYTMPDNTIYVKGGVRISEISVSPPIFTPTSHEDGGVPKKVKIGFELSRSATAELVVFDASSGTVAATREYSSLSQGPNTVEYDGRDNNGVRLKPGSYTVGVRAVDERGYRSIMRFNIMRIAY